MWKYKNKDYTELHDPTLYGFVYLMIWERNGKYKMYIGKKNFFSERRISKNKKELAARVDKRESKKKIVKKESNWRDYYSSNEFLKKQPKSEITRIILRMCESKMQLTYEEAKLQLTFEVLENDIFLNNNILGKFYKTK